MPFFSIIIATHNSAKTLEKTLLSILEQSSKSFEIIIIDGLSKDGTKSIIKKYENKISVFVEEKDSGIYEAMNKGAIRSSGEYLYFLNSDDQFFDNKVLEDVYNLLEKDPKIDLLTANVLKKFSKFSTLKNNKFSKRNLKNGVMPPHQAMFVKKDVFLEAGGFDEKYKSSGDFDFCCKIIGEQIKYQYLDRNIAFFIAGGLSSRKDIAYIETTQIINKYFGKFLACSFYFKKVIMEQGFKKCLSYLRFHKVNEFLTMLAMKLNKE